MTISGRKIDTIFTHLENLVNNETHGRTEQRDYSLSLETAITENKLSQWVQFGNNPHVEREGQK